MRENRIEFEPTDTNTPFGNLRKGDYFVYRGALHIVTAPGLFALRLSDTELLAFKNDAVVRFTHVTITVHAS